MEQDLQSNYQGGMLPYDMTEVLSEKKEACIFKDSGYKASYKKYAENVLESMMDVDPLTALYLLLSQSC